MYTVNIHYVVMETYEIPDEAVKNNNVDEKVAVGMALDEKYLVRKKTRDFGINDIDHEEDTVN